MTGPFCSIMFSLMVVIGSLVFRQAEVFQPAVHTAATEKLVQRLSETPISMFMGVLHNWCSEVDSVSEVSRRSSSGTWTHPALDRLSLLLPVEAKSVLRASCQTLTCLDSLLLPLPSFFHLLHPSCVNFNSLLVTCHKMYFQRSHCIQHCFDTKF